MTLVPVPESRLDDLLPILKRRVAELVTPIKAEAEVYLEFVKAGYSRRLVAAYVDDLDNPSRILVLSHYPDTWTRSVVCNISLLYTVPEHRGSIAWIKNVVKTAEAYARIYGAAFVLAGSFDLGSNKKIGSLWKRLGYDEASTSYLKVL